MAKAPKPTPKPAAKASKASAKPLPKKAPPPPKAKKARGLDLAAAEEAADEGVQAAMAEAEALPAQPARPIPLAQLRHWSGNPRKNLGDVSELAASLKSVGLIHHLLARPHPSEAGAYEVAAGNRRLAAAQLAGLPELATVVRPLSDRQMLEIALTENGQRSDVHPLEEARALHQLHRQHKVEVAELSARLGRGDGYIRQRLRLMHLASVAAEAFEANRLSLAVAMRLARLPEKAQKAALPQLLVDDGEAPKPLNGVRWVLERCHLRLAGSPFALDDESLPGGSCLACPKRTGNQLVIFEAEPDDLCTDPDCHKGKVDEAKARKIKVAVEKGDEVLPAKESPFDWGGRVRHDAAFIDLDAPVPEPEPEPEEDEYESDDQTEGDEEQDDTTDQEEKPEPPRRTWRDVLGDKVKVVLAEDRNGKLHELVRHDEARDALPPNAPAELHEAVALREEEEKREPRWKKEHAEATARRQAHEARAKALAAKVPLLDPRAFRVAILGILVGNAWPYEDALKELGAWKEKEGGHHDKEATNAAVRALPTEALWRLWLADVLSNETDIDLDELEAFEAPAQPMRPVAPAPASDPELLPPSDPRSAAARTPALPLEEPAPVDDEEVLAALTLDTYCADPLRALVKRLRDWFIDDEATAAELAESFHLGEEKVATIERLAEKAQASGLLEVARTGENGTRWWRPTLRGRLLGHLDGASKPLGAMGLARTCGVDLAELHPILNAALEAGEISKQKAGYRIVAGPRLVARQQAARAKAEAKKAKAGAS